AVSARVASADHDDMLAGGADRLAHRGLCHARLRTVLAGHEAVALVEVVHREVDALQLAPWHAQIARNARSGRKHDGVEALAQLSHGDVGAHVHPTAQLHALGDQLLHAPLYDALLDLEVGHPEAHKPPRGLVALEQGHGVSDAAQLLRGRHAGGTRTDDRDRLTRLPLGRLRPNPAFAEGPVDDRELDLLDRDRVALADLQDTCRLA